MPTHNTSYTTKQMPAVNIPNITCSCNSHWPYLTTFDIDLTFDQIQHNYTNKNSYLTISYFSPLLCEKHQIWNKWFLKLMSRNRMFWMQWLNRLYLNKYEISLKFLSLKFTISFLVSDSVHIILHPDQSIAEENIISVPEATLLKYIATCIEKFA
jgi:hypothetical protein